MERTHRYLLFGGDHYYPGGGWDDFLSSHESFEEARTAGLSFGGDWCHIVDLETMDTIVWGPGQHMREWQHAG